MKRLMQDLGDLTGLDIVADTRCAPVRGAAARLDNVPTGASVALAWGTLRWLGLAATNDERCRVGGSSDADPVRAAASRGH